MQKILVATTNKGKLREIKSILNNFEILSLEDINCKIDVLEDGKTFKENALKKAREISKATNMNCIADDSGLCIDEFDGWPGIRTARFLGDNSTPEQRNDYILNKMQGLEKQRRRAKHCVSIAYVGTDGKEIAVQAENNGYIADAPKGQNGFGFDVIFELEDGRTQAELSEKEKNNISSRRKALELLKEQLKRLHPLQDIR